MIDVFLLILTLNKNRAGVLNLVMILYSFFSMRGNVPILFRNKRRLKKDDDETILSFLNERITFDHHGHCKDFYVFELNSAGVWQLWRNRLHRASWKPRTTHAKRVVRRWRCRSVTIAFRPRIFIFSHCRLDQSPRCPSIRILKLFLMYHERARDELQLRKLHRIRYTVLIKKRRFPPSDVSRHCDKLRFRKFSGCHLSFD